jgi:hypothetical protein
MTKSKISHYHNQPMEGTILCRYVTIDKLLDFLLNERIPMVRLNVFQDKLEGVHINHLMLNYGSEKVGGWIGEMIKHVTINVNANKRNSLRRQREIFQNTNYASCWYMNDHESVAMWQLYSKPDSVAIRIPYTNLSNSLQSGNFRMMDEYAKIRYGSVDYYRFNNLEDLSKILVKEDTTGFVKDQSFQHEQEFRILAEFHEFDKNNLERKSMILDENIERLNELNQMKVIYLTFTNFKDLPFEIVFHPQSSSWHRQNICKILNNYQIPFKTFESSLKEILQQNRT